MIIALVFQFFIAIALYKTYSVNHLYEENENILQKVKPIKKVKLLNTDLAIVDELKWVIRREYLMDVIIDGRFKIGEKLGSEGFTGFVRSGVDLQTGEDIAIKFSTKELYYSLEKEFVNYLYLGGDDPEVVQYGIPHLIHYGDFGGYKVLVLTKAGPTLSYLLKSTKWGKFKMTTICKIAMQAIRIFEYIHSKGLLFHDVKPQNMAIGHIEKNRIVFFDFAFSEFHVNALGESKRRENANEMSGTPEYMGRGPLHSQTHVRKDDLISLGLVLLDLNGVKLPWMDEINSEQDIYEAMDIVLDIWDNHTIEAICENSDDPELFNEYFEYFDKIESQDRPDYDALVEFFASKLTDDELADDDLGIFNEEDVIIDGRFNVTESLFDDRPEFYKTGVDMKTDTEVSILFYRKELYDFANQEYENFLYLEAENPEVIEHGIPHLHYFGQIQEYKVFVTSHIDSTLHELLQQSDSGKFEIDIICKIAIKAFRILEYIHSKGLVFRIIRSKNMAINKLNQIFFLDFSYSEFYLNSLGDPREMVSSYPDKTSFYIVDGYLNGRNYDRIDDFLLLGVVLLELNGVSIPSKEEVDNDKDWNKYGLYTLCDSSDKPDLLIKYFDYLYDLEPLGEPNYDILVEFFAKELTSEQLENKELGIFPPKL